MTREETNYYIKHLCAVALLIRCEADGDETELANLSFTVKQDALTYLITFAQAERGEDCYHLENDLITLYYYPEDADLSPLDHLAKHVAELTA